MRKTTSSEIKRGQAITFRVPSDASDHTLLQLQQLKEREKRNFSSKLAQFVLNGVGSDLQQDMEFITLPLPHCLNKAQRDWLKHAHSEAMLGSILYELLTNPMRATALFASLNDDPIEVTRPIRYEEERELPLPEIVMDFDDFDNLEDDKEQDKQQPIELEEQLDELLGDFLAQMNK